MTSPAKKKESPHKEVAIVDKGRCKHSQALPLKVEPSSDAFPDVVNSAQPQNANPNSLSFGYPFGYPAFAFPAFGFAGGHGQPATAQHLGSPGGYPYQPMYQNHLPTQFAGEGGGFVQPAQVTSVSRLQPMFNVSAQTFGASMGAGGLQSTSQLQV